MSVPQPIKPRNLIKTRILHLSDTHATASTSDTPSPFPFSSPLPPCALAIHTGDLTLHGKPPEHLLALQLLKSLPTPIKLVIPGNHDLTLDKHYLATHPTLYGWNEPHSGDETYQQARDIYTSQEARDAGIMYLETGTHEITLMNGAKLRIWVSAYTPEFCDWAFAYPMGCDPYMSEATVHHDSCDGSYRVMKETGEGYSKWTPFIHPPLDFDEQTPTIWLTHGPPLGILDTTTGGEHVGCEGLMRAVERCRPILHCFGHIHEGHGVESREWRSGSKANVKGRVCCEDYRDAAKSVDATEVVNGRTTVFVNSSIMDVNYRPCQKPFVIDVMLSAAATDK